MLSLLRKKKKKKKIKPIFTEEEVQHAISEALEEGYKASDIRKYFYDKGFKPIDLFRITNNTNFKKYQIATDSMVVLALIQLSLGLLWLFSHLPQLYEKHNIFAKEYFGFQLHLPSFLYSNFLTDYLRENRIDRVLDDSGISYYQLLIGLLLSLCIILHINTKSLLFFLFALIIVLIDILYYFSLVGLYENVVYTLFVKVFIFFWILRGMKAYALMTYTKIQEKNKPRKKT